MSKTNEIIHIAFITDENFAFPTGVALVSLLKNKNEFSRYQIYVLCNDVSDDIKKRFLTYNCKDFSVQIMELDGFEALETIGQRTEHVSKTAMFKFKLAELFPDIDKLLYLDGDILILNDLGELYNTDIEQYYVAAVKDMAPVVKYKPHVGKKLNLPESYIYFNSGVMLLNLKLMRAHNIAERLLTYRKNGKNYFMDQDAFNVVLGARMKELPVRFNNEITIYEQFSTFQIAKFFGISQSDVGTTQVKDVVILHLTSKTKPWKYNLPYYTDLFRSYQAISSFEDIELSLLPYPEKEVQPSIKERIKKFFTVLKKDGPKAAVKKIWDWLSKHRNDSILKPIYIPYRFIKTKIRRAYLWFKEGKILKTQCTQSLYCGEPRKKKIIVSLTSFPGRIHEVPTTILALLQQTMKPDRITLWLTPEEFPKREKELPQRLTRLENYGLEICWGENLRAHTKYFHIMKECPEDIVITVDDDIHYGCDLIETLYCSYQKHPDAVSAMRVHLMTWAPDGNLDAYIDWKYEYCGIRDIPSMWLFATGVGGILYPPHCMHDEIFNMENLKKYSFAADDVWLKFMQIMNCTPVVFCGDGQKLQFVGDTQSVGLCYSNVQGGGNDEMIRTMMDRYDRFFGKEDTLTNRLKTLKTSICPICKHELGCSQADTICPRCGASGQGRLLYLYMQNKTNLIKASKRRILHFSPEAWLSEILSQEQFKHDYYPVDSSNEYPGYIRAVVDPRRIPFPNELFDVVIAIKSFKNIEEETRILAEIRRVLKKKAVAYIGIPDPPNQKGQDAAGADLTVVNRLAYAGFKLVDVNYSEDLTKEERVLYSIPEPDFVKPRLYIYKK